MSQSQQLSQCFSLKRHDLITPLNRQVEESLHRSPIKALAILRRALDFYEFAGGGVGDVHVDLGLGVEVVVEVEVGLVIDDADADGGELVGEGVGGVVEGGNKARGECGGGGAAGFGDFTGEFFDGVGEGDVCAADGGGSGSAVGL